MANRSAGRNPGDRCEPVRFIELERTAAKKHVPGATYLELDRKHFCRVLFVSAEEKTNVKNKSVDEYYHCCSTASGARGGRVGYWGRGVEDVRAAVQ